MKPDQKPVLNSTLLDVRRVLQDQLNRLNQPDADVKKEHQRSLAIQLVAQPLIASAKIEAELMMKHPKYMGTGFVGGANPKQLEQQK